MSASVGCRKIVIVTSFHNFGTGPTVIGSSEPHTMSLMSFPCLNHYRVGIVNGEPAHPQVASIHQLSTTIHFGSGASEYAN